MSMFQGIDIPSKLPSHVNAHVRMVESSLSESRYELLGRVVFEHNFLPLHHIKIFFVNPELKMVQVADVECWNPDAKEVPVQQKEEDWKLIHRINVANMRRVAARIQNG